MFSPRTGMKIESFCTVKIREPLYLIFYGMGMHYIHHHRNPHRMSTIHKTLKIFRSPKAGAQCKKAGDLIPKRTIIWMLLQSHNLQGIISQFLYAGQNVFFKICKYCYSLLLSAHSYMRLIHKRILAL